MKNEKVRENILTNRDIIKKIEKGIDFTEEEKDILRNYSGQNSHPLSKELNTEYYTPDIVTKFIIDMLDINSSSGDLADLSCGIGNMFKYIHNKKINMFGYELDYISSRISQILYPNAKIHKMNTIEEKNNLPKFDFIIGNPPFGDKIEYDCMWGNDKKNNKIKKQSIDTIFLDIAINSLKEGGFLGMVVPDGVLSNSGQKPIREYIFKECKLIGVVSLPSETFMYSGIGGTGAKTSVLFLQKLKQKEKIYKTNKNGHVASEFQPPVFMAIVEDGGLGWDNKGKKTGKDDLKIILEAFKKGCGDVE